MYGAQRTCQPNCFLLSCVVGITYLYLQLKSLAQRGHTHFEGSKSTKNVVKCGQKERELRNLLEVLNLHYNNYVGEFRGKN